MFRNRKIYAIVSQSILIFSIVALYLSENVLDRFGLTLRFWLKWVAYFGIVCISVIAAILMIGFAIKKFKEKAGKRNIITGLCSLLTAFINLMVTGIFLFMLMITQSSVRDVRIIIENGEKYIVQKETIDIEGGPYVEYKYKYVNWFIQGSDNLYPHGNYM